MKRRPGRKAEPPGRPQQWLRHALHSAGKNWAMRSTAQPTREPSDQNSGQHARQEAHRRIVDLGRGPAGTRPPDPRASSAPTKGPPTVAIMAKPSRIKAEGRS